MLMSKITSRKHFKAPEPAILHPCYILYWDKVWKGTPCSLSLAFLAGEELWRMLALSRQDNCRPGQGEHTTPGGPLRHTHLNNISFAYT